MAKVESTVKRVMARDEFPYEWDVIENEWITMSDGLPPFGACLAS